MWYGKNTQELEKLNKEYEKMFGCYPCDYDELGYGDEEYEEYIKDIKKAICRKKELPDILE